PSEMAGAALLLAAGLACRRRRTTAR
ncbi:MprA protease, GlyGly-CTERM protein-sorting domain-containing form, partial [Ralstonia solanacearum]